MCRHLARLLMMSQVDQNYGGPESSKHVVVCLSAQWEKHSVAQHRNIVSCTWTCNNPMCDSACAGRNDLLNNKGGSRWFPERFSRPTPTRFRLNHCSALPLCVRASAPPQVFTFFLWTSFGLVVFELPVSQSLWQHVRLSSFKSELIWMKPSREEEARLLRKTKKKKEPTT